MIFVCSATHKTKSMFFFLAQTEQGDIFKVTLETDEEMVGERRPQERHSAATGSSECSSRWCHMFACVLSGDRDPAEVLRHHPRGHSHVRPEDWLFVCGL